MNEPTKNNNENLKRILTYDGYQSYKTMEYWEPLQHPHQ